MAKFTVTALLLSALVLPIVLFWQLSSHLLLGALAAAAIAVVSGWILNVSWAYATQATTAQNSQADGRTLKIAAAFGWVCPVVLVFLTWLVLRFFA